MLGIDAIVMLYHCANVSVGDILEVGAYTGGATIAMAIGVRDSGMLKQVISIERGCRVDHPRIGTKDSFKGSAEEFEALRVSRSGYFDKRPLVQSARSTACAVRFEYGFYVLVSCAIRC